MASKTGRREGSKGNRRFPLKDLKETVGFLYYNVHISIGKARENQDSTCFVL
jgi:hypothetical protein